MRLLALETISATRLIGRQLDLGHGASSAAPHGSSDLVLLAVPAGRQWPG